MVKAYSYIRMSTPEQLKGDSVRRQHKAMLDYIAKMGWELTDIIQDHGVSAFKGQNAQIGALSNFMALAQSGSVEAGSFLIVESLDRLTRQNILEAITFLNQIIRLGINVVTLMDEKVYSKETIENSDTDLIIASIVMMRAHDESKAKSRRLSSAWEQKRTTARNGSITRQKLPPWLRFSTDGSRIETIEDRVALIREIFELSRDGWGAYSIAKSLNAKATPTWGRAQMWQESYIKKLLGNRSVLGEYQPHKLSWQKFTKTRTPVGKPIRTYYPKIIDEVTFEEAKDSMSRRRISGAGRKGSQYPNLFTGLLQCGHCSSGLRYIDKGQKPKGGQYLQCSRSILTRQCNATAMRYGDVEELLVSLIRDINFDVVLNGTEWESELKQLKLRKIELDSQRILLTESIERIIDAIAAAPTSKSLTRKLMSLEAEQDVIDESIKIIDRQISDLSGASVPAKNELLRRLNDPSLDQASTVILRRKVNTEICRFIKFIRISTLQVYPWEDEPKTHHQKNNLNVEVMIRYRNSSYVYFNADGSINIYGKVDEKQKMFIEKARINRLK